MSRDERLNRTQEVVGSIPISSTNEVRNQKAESRRASLPAASARTIRAFITIASLLRSRRKSLKYRAFFIFSGLP